jgi:FkbM family methyltransferase
LSTILAQMVAPWVRLYIRYSPVGFFKSELWHRVGRTPRDYIARTRFGALMAGNSEDLIQGYVYFFGIWEPNLTSFVVRRLSSLSRRTFVDVGANVGYFSLLVAKYMPAGNVVSIEPFPSIHSKLRKNVELNEFRNVRTIQCAVAEAECEVDMFHAGAANEGATTSVRGTFATDPVRVPAKPLSELLTAAEIQSIRLVKIDVEGAEHSVVRGMRSMIDGLPFDAEIAVEVTPDLVGRDAVAEIFDVFERAGFFPYVVENRYCVRSYWGSHGAVRPLRIRSLPAVQTDVIFSRIDAERL